MTNIGKNIARIRLFKLIGQKEMADFLKISQQEYSRIEQKAAIDDRLLESIAAKLDCPVDIIKSLEQVEFTNQTVHQNDGNKGIGINISSSEQITALYERLLKEKDDVIALQKEQIRQLQKGV